MKGRVSQLPGTWSMLTAIVMSIVMSQATLVGAVSAAIKVFGAHQATAYCTHAQM